jgi:hypothetical protein
VGGVCASTGPGPGPESCPTGQIRCGDLCVDPTSNESHCGGCGLTCQGELTCVNGTCGCADAADTKCGTSCVETFLDDDEHCGGCGQACPGGQNCVAGQCQPDGGCSGGQVTCGGECVNTQTDTRHCGACSTPCTVGRCVGGQCIECVGQADCGGFSSSNDLVCRAGRCECADTNKGLCQRHADRSGSCHVCCPGGSQQCPGPRNETCFIGQLSTGQRYGYCDCATGWDRCEGAGDICVEDTSRDDRHCGRFCTDCHAAQDVNAKGVCCNGICAMGCGPGSFGTGCAPDSPCGPNCNPCGPGFICCNMGPGTPPRCILNKNGFCYRED